MHLVEIPLSKFTYRFRRLTWQEEARVKIADGEDTRLVVLAHALHDISGLPVTSFEEARSVIAKIPATIRRRLWVLYRGNLPEDRYFTVMGLYDAPDHRAYNKRLIDTGEASGEDAAIERRFGTEEAQAARELEQKLLGDARARRK